jgi:ankyrin repeat protein
MIDRWRTAFGVSVLVLVLVLASFSVTAEYLRVRKSNAVHAAVFRGDISRVEELLDAGMPIDQINEDRVFGLIRIRSYPYAFENGVTPLYVAVCRSDLKLAKLLLNRGADVNYPVHGPYTILQRGVTAFFGSVDIHGTGISIEAPEEIKLQIVRLLVEAGADIHERKYAGAETAIEMCERMDLPDVKQLLDPTATLSSQETQTSN